MQRLFIYGTLGPDGPNKHVLQKIDGQWSKASIRGTLVKEGWGADMGYPGLILSDEGAEVTGDLFSSENLYLNWEFLDEFEGDGYQRVQAEVTLSTGENVTAYVYVLSRS